MSKVVERFRIGGQRNGDPSMPSSVLQRAIGTIIKVNIEAHTLSVPTKDGFKTACVGDTVICFEDGTFDVEVDA